MDRFDDLITRGDLRLAHAQAHLAAGAGAQRLLGRYYVAATAGTTGEPGIFVWDVDEWADVLASYSRAYSWAGASVQLTTRTRMAVVSWTAPSHQSALVGASVDSRFIPTLRVDSGEQLEDVVRRLNDFRPDVLVGYASMLGLLAGEQRAGRLHVQPEAVLSASEVLTGHAVTWSRPGTVVPSTCTRPPRPLVSPPSAASTPACTSSRTWSSPRSSTTRAAQSASGSTGAGCWSPSWARASCP